MKSPEFCQIEPVINLREVARRTQAPHVETAVDALRFIGREIIELPYEQCIALYCDAEMRPISFVQCGRGTMWRTPSDLRTVCSCALLLHSQNVLLIHSHPPIGTSRKGPSIKDLEAASYTRETLERFGIRLCDSLVVEQDEEDIHITSIMEDLK